MMQIQWFLSISLLLLLCAEHAASLPLSTHGRWVVDRHSGRRVKLGCVNWAAHMPAVLAEGLDRQPLASIATGAASLGFNCIRLTWATHLFTNDRYEKLTVAASLGSLGLAGAAAGVVRNNPRMMGMTVREAYEEVVKAAGEAGLMVVLDNHVSRPQWCCGGDDGNGFFGDHFFDTEEWLRGLELVAKRFRRFPQVVGMSMRNELRGPNQSEAIWYRNVALGASTIHAANPNVIVIISGLSFDTDLSFLHRHPLVVPFITDKLILEAHWYAFSDRQRRDWADDPPARVCSDSARRFDQRAGFVTAGGEVPLFVSEFGVDQRGTSRGDERFLSCFLAFAAERDLDWALWALQGSYYFRNGQAGFEETYGVLDSGWERPKNPRFRERFGLIQEMLQDPKSTVAPYQIIYHPASGRCVGVDEEEKVLLVGCEHRGRWNYQGDGSVQLLTLAGHCLRLDGEGLPVRLSTECSNGQSKWSVVSGFQAAGVDEQGKQLCLDGSGSSNSTATVVVARECMQCVNGSVCDGKPQSQWFRFITSNMGYHMIAE